jgi:hypothetical protein
LHQHHAAVSTLIQNSIFTHELGTLATFVLVRLAAKSFDGGTSISFPCLDLCTDPEFVALASDRYVRNVRIGPCPSVSRRRALMAAFVQHCALSPFAAMLCVLFPCHFVLARVFSISASCSTSAQPRCCLDGGEAFRVVMGGWWLSLLFDGDWLRSSPLFAAAEERGETRTSRGSTSTAASYRNITYAPSRLILCTR